MAAAAVAARRKDDEVRRLGVDQPCERDADIVSPQGKHANAQTPAGQRGAHPFEIGPRRLLVALDDAPPEQQVLRFQRPRLRQFRHRDDVRQQQFGIGGLREPGGQRQHAFGPARAVDRNDDPAVSGRSKPGVDRDEQDRARDPVQHVVGGSADAVQARVPASARPEDDQPVAVPRGEAAYLVGGGAFRQRHVRVRRRGLRRRCDSVPRASCFMPPQVPFDRIGPRFPCRPRFEDVQQCERRAEGLRDRESMGHDRCGLPGRVDAGRDTEAGR